MRKTSVAQTKWVYISNLSISNKSLWVNFDRRCCTEPFVLVLRLNSPACCSLSSKKKWQDYVSLPDLRYLEQKQLEYEHMRESKKKREQWKQRITEKSCLVKGGSNSNCLPLSNVWYRLPIVSSRLSSLHWILIGWRPLTLKLKSKGFASDRYLRIGDFCLK